jgi:subtilisin family serine protease
MVAPPELYRADKRIKWGLETKDSPRGPYVIELNLQHIEGLNGAAAQLEALLNQVMTEKARQAHPAVQLARTYYRCDLTVSEWKALLAKDADEAEKEARHAKKATEMEAKGASAANPTMRAPSALQYRAIYKLWPDFPVKAQIYRSMPTIKADAALRSYEAAGDGIVWAVLDSGIHAGHLHFKSQATLDAPEVRDLHRCFVKVPGEGFAGFAGAPVLLPDPDAKDISKDKDKRRERIELHRSAALTDEFGHGTHVAGIIAGAAPNAPTPSGVAAFTLERVYRTEEDSPTPRSHYEAVQHGNASRFRGVAPKCKLVSLKVLDDKGDGRSSEIIRALAYVREQLNDNPKLLRVHGVNLSVGYEFDAEMFACGQSPVCAEVNRLVQSGVVVVTAAGNTGYGMVGAQVRATKVGLSNTINDPGNADFAITVGATHRESPHTFGVSYFSSKGPTGDGRLKPDLVAPGERITSCAAGRRLTEALKSATDGPNVAGELKQALKSGQNDGAAYYVEDSGTSMAAPHVSGAIAAFLSIRREFIGKPHDVKKIFTSTATPLGRERYFEGHGLLDLIRAIQSV